MDSRSIDLSIYKMAYASLNIDAVDFIYNDDQSYVLGIYKVDESSSKPLTTKYVVLDVENESIVVKNSVVGGNVKWVSTYEIEIIDPPGIMKDDAETLEDYTTILNVKTGKESKKTADRF
ncbi:hypothetical protein ABWH96_09165 [Marivirga tractuosa]|uniref:hypothetical protein n=1 Tax=Marivirga tractuosa TaxID=1006 RepID=UPI0035D0EC85